MSADRLKRAIESVKKDPATWERGFADYLSAVPAKYSVAQDGAFRTDDKKALETLVELLSAEVISPAGAPPKRSNPEKVVCLLEVIRRLLQYKTLYKGVGKQGIVAFVDCLKNADSRISTAAIHAADVLLHFLGSAQPFAKTDASVVSGENQNKADFHMMGGFTELVKIGTKLDPEENGPLLSTILRILGATLVYGGRSTPMEAVNSSTSITPEFGSLLAKLTLHPNAELAYAASLYAEGIIVHGKDISRHIQDEALRQGTTLRHFVRALYAKAEVKESKDADDWTVGGRGIQDMALDIFAILVENHSDGLKCIFRILPRNFQDSLTEQVPQIAVQQVVETKEDHHAPEPAAEKKTGKGAGDKKLAPSTPAAGHVEKHGSQSSVSNIVWAKYIGKRNSRSNWAAVFRDVQKDIIQPHLLWGPQCREDLKRSLEAELVDLDHQFSVNPEYVWDYEGFEVVYSALEAELQVDSYYVRLLIPALETEGSTYEVNPKEVSALVTHLYNRIVVEDDPTWKLACLRALTAVYRKYKEMLHVKVFEPLPYLIWLLNPKHAIPIWRDHILRFMLDLITYQGNARLFLKLGGVDYLISYLASVHIVNPEVKEDPPEGSRRNSVDDGRKAYRRVPAKSEWNVPPEVMTKFDVAHQVLEILTELFHQLPRVRKLISRSTHFNHMIQFLLCDDKRLSRRMIGLIRDIIVDSPWVIPNLVATGFFEFVLFAIPDSPLSCYIDIWELVHKYHLKQAVNFIPPDESTMHRYFPTPMVRLLRVSGPEEFLKVFNSQRDEAHLLWDQSLRGNLAEQIRNKFVAFKQQLSSTPLTIYQWTYPDRIAYPAIDEEICIGTMYLRLYNERKGSGYTCAFPEFWIMHLVRAMDYPLDDRNLSYLLDAHRTAVARHGNLPEIQQYGYFPQLFRTLTRPAETEVDVYLIQLASDTLTGLITVPQVDPNQKENAFICFDNHGVEAVSVSILNLVIKDASVATHHKLLIDVLNILDILLTKVRDPAIPILLDNRRLLAEITKLFDFDFAAKFPHIAIQALHLFKTCTDFAELRQAFLENGAIVHLIYLTIFAPYDSADQSEPTRVVQAASIALSGLCGYHPESPKLQLNQGIRKTLRALITPGLHRELVNPYKYVDVSRTNWVNPILIWNEGLRTELKGFLLNEIEEIRKSAIWNRWEQEAFPFSFNGLAKEIIVDDVYVYVYNKQEDMIPNPPDQFMGELLKAVRVVANGLDRDSKDDVDSGKSFHYVTTCAFALTRLIKWHPEILKCPHKDFQIEILNELFENRVLHPDVLHSALLILEQYATFDLTTEVFITPYQHVLHRLVNIPRGDTLSNLPSLLLTLHIISELCLRNPSVVDSYVTSGFVITLLYIFVNHTVYWPEHRQSVSRLIGILCNDAVQNENFKNLFCQLIAGTFKELLVESKNDPKKLIKHFDTDWDTPVRFWTENCRKDLLVFLNSEMRELRDYQTKALKTGVITPPYSWQWNTIGQRFKQWTLDSQLCIDEIYVNAFNANPFFQVKPDRFFSMLIQGLHVEWEKYVTARDSGDDEHTKPAVSNIISLWESVNHILTNLPHLQDGCVSELEFLFNFFNPQVHVPLQEMALRISCLLASNSVCAENIAKQGLLCKVMPLLVTMESKTVEVLGLMMDLIRRSSPSVKQIRSLGGIIILINILLQKRTAKERRDAAMVISAMIQDKTYGKASGDYAVKVLTAEFRGQAFQARPEKFVGFAMDDHESLEDNRVWTDDQRDALRSLFGQEVKELAKIMPTWDGKSDLFDMGKLSVVWKDIHPEAKDNS
eukprot:TRINITY_DN15116_c0_g1_i1.p1 TRINITY_DN15116_c0_g1~~TRINITY_DN15116_c0_g1_i1.p1  ORF type:complete len:1790 (-),score=434.50 TRINITY_DN15116_c0_g1_i1:55-5424(-)